MSTDRESTSSTHAEQLRRCQTDLARLADQIAELRDSHPSRYERELSRLEAARNEAEQKLAELDSADERAWEGLRLLVEDATAKVSDGIDALKRKLSDSS